MKAFLCPSGRRNGSVALRHRWIQNRASVHFSKHALTSTFPICMAEQIRIPLAGAAVRDRVKTFRISVSGGEMRKVGLGTDDGPRRPEKLWRHRGLA